MNILALVPSKAVSLVLALLVLSFSELGATGQTVTIASGTLEGSPMGDAGAVFLGIPFAAPPVGELRWRDPQPVVPWKGVRQAKKYAPSAMQYLSPDGFLEWTVEFCVQNEVSEDCLYLNVWTPRLDAGAKLPVIVFIHGGAFIGGSGEVPLYDGTRLAANGAVVVTINYRLGIFGFFAHPELTAESSHKASGNYGLMDQIAALRWVKENIGAFGGDCERVTIWGQSAGACSVSALLVSDEAKGLFQRAVANSGLALLSRSAAPLAAAEAEGVRVAAEHKANGIDALRKVSAEELLKWECKYRHPITDGWILGKSLRELADSGAGSDVPVMTGYIANDSKLETPNCETLDAWNAYVDKTFVGMAQEFRRLYPMHSNEQARAVILEASRDRERVVLALFSELRGKLCKSPVYTYYFTRAIPWPQHPEYGAFHSADLPYFFDNLKILDRPWTNVDHALAATASSYLAAFAANGDPNGSDLPRWDTSTSERAGTQELGERVGPMPAVDDAKTAFWKRALSSDIAENLPFL